MRERQQIKRDLKRLRRTEEPAAKALTPAIDLLASIGGRIYNTRHPVVYGLVIASSIFFHGIGVFVLAALLCYAYRRKQKC